jgi:hypothetical protein
MPSPGPLDCLFFGKGENFISLSDVKGSDVY